MTDTTTTETPTTHTTDTSPRIYVASLSDYNAGRLLGRWIDADQDAADIHAAIEAMLATSPEPIAEEWAIHDFEGFGGWRLSEYESIETVATVASQIAEHGEFFGGLLNHCSDLAEALRYMEDGYRGEWESLTDYVETFIDDVYGREIKALPEIVRYHISYEGIARDFELSGDIFTIECGRKVHVFDSNI